MTQERKSPPPHVAINVVTNPVPKRTITSMKISLTIAICVIMGALSMVLLYTAGYMLGHRHGYGEAMADCLFELTTPEEFFGDESIHKKLHK